MDFSCPTTTERHVRDVLHWLRMTPEMRWNLTYTGSWRRVRIVFFLQIEMMDANLSEPCVRVSCIN